MKAYTWYNDHVKAIDNNATMNYNEFLRLGFLYENGNFVRYEPVGITWNDNFCRKLTSYGSSGCYVKRLINISQIIDMNHPMNNCSGQFWNKINNLMKVNFTRIYVFLKQMQNLLNVLVFNGKIVKKISQMRSMEQIVPFQRLKPKLNISLFVLS